MGNDAKRTGCCSLKPFGIPAAPGRFRRITVGPAPAALRLVVPLVRVQNKKYEPYALIEFAEFDAHNF